MPNSNRGNIVNVDAAGALTGDGSSGNPLAVNPDGVTVTINGSNELVATTSGTGNVAAAAGLTDNAVVRGDGGVHGVQTSGVLINDSDQISGVDTLTFANTKGITFNGAGANPITVTGGNDGAGNTALVFDDSVDNYIVAQYNQYLYQYCFPGLQINTSIGEYFVTNDGGTQYASIEPTGGITSWSGLRAVGGWSDTSHAYGANITVGSLVGAADGVSGVSSVANATSNSTTSFGTNATLNLATATTHVAVYGASVVVNANGTSAVSGGAWGVLAELNINDTATAVSPRCFEGDLTTAVGATVVNGFGFWAGDLVGQSSGSSYAFWYDGGPGGDASKAGVWRVNQFGIMAYYNPAFAKYEPDATNFEREIVRWGDTGTFGTTNVAYMGVEVGGTGTDRTLTLLGDGVQLESAPGTATFLQVSEMTVPSAPAANGVRIYAVDNGAGKTQLMALFSSGAAQQIAIQP